MSDLRNIKFWKVKKVVDCEERTAPSRRLKTGCLLAMLLGSLVYLTGLVHANDGRALDHVATTYTQTQDSASRWQMAEMVCCHCYSTKSDGTRFYHGVLEAGFCRSQRGYCEGFAKCFP